MNETIMFNKLKEVCANVQQNVDIAPLTTYRIGGKADYCCELKDFNHLPGLVKAANELNIPYLIIGGGSNTVFSDEGFRGLIIHNKDAKIEVNGSRLTCSSGIMLSMAIKGAKKHDLGGISRLIGLPGTIGGAVYGNAGAQGVEIGDFLEKAILFSKEKGVFEVNNDYFHFEYRTSILKQTGEIVLQVTLKLPKLDEKDEIDAINKFRNIKQPKGFSAGSFFKNPSSELPAGYLIDQAGLKGLREGDIEVSDLHANWLINKGNGKQKDVIKLAKRIIETVKKRFNIRLKPENILLDAYGNRIDI